MTDTLLPAENGDVLELDELCSFVGRKLNSRWVWIVLCRQTRQVVAYFVSDRSADSARALRERIPPDYRCRATRSDWWLSYAEAFPRRTHRSSGKGAGETCYVERWNNTLRQRLSRFARKTLFLLQVRVHIRSGSALVRASLQHFTRIVITTYYLPHPKSWMAAERLRAKLGQRPRRARPPKQADLF